MPGTAEFTNVAVESGGICERAVIRPQVSGDDSEHGGVDSQIVLRWRILRIRRDRIRHLGTVEDVDKLAPEIEVVFAFFADAEVTADIGVLLMKARRAEIAIQRRSRRASRVS